MVATPVYMDNHATTRVDPRVVDAIVPLFAEQYGNPSSTSHVFGWDSSAAVEKARKEVAVAIGATEREIVFTSGATESNNLAIQGAAHRLRRKGQHLISVVSEHRAVLDCMARLGREGYEVTLIPVAQQDEGCPGRIDLQQLEEAIRPDTTLISMMLANNETGVLQLLGQVGQVCKQKGVLLHSDATQAVGRVEVDVESLQVDLLSFSAHKFYGPKGVGGLYVRRANPQVRLEPLVEGGGHEQGRRSGTLNAPGIVGMGVAIRIAVLEMESEATRIRGLRDQLHEGIQDAIERVQLNGPPLDESRLPGNLNMSFLDVDGEALMMSMKDLAVSSGSACTSVDPEPSHVLRALGLSDDETRASLRFGLGRFNTVADVEFAIEQVSGAVERLRRMRP
jgi:cysteine desulfurase